MQTRRKINSGKINSGVPVPAADSGAPAADSGAPAAELSVVYTTPTKEKKSKKSKASNDPITIILESYLEECTRFNDIVDFLDFDNIRSLSCTNKRILNDISTSTGINIIWKSLLYSVVIDEWKDYEIKIEKERRDLIEKYFGCRKIALAIKSNTCSSCGSFTTNLDLLTCSRACLDCWTCKDSGERGTDSKSSFALCAFGYAKTHYLLSDSDISKNLLVLTVNDPDRSHGLLQERLKVVSDNQARAIAIKKFGGLEGFNQEKTDRAAKSEKKWLDKCNKAKAEGKSSPAMPDQIRKEKEKGNPNFICVNQRYSKLVSNSSRYGYYKGIFGTNHLTNILPLSLPTFIVTDATNEELESEYEGYSISRYTPAEPVASSSSTSSTVSGPTVETDIIDRDNSVIADTVSSDQKVVNKITPIASSECVCVTATVQPKLVVFTNLVDAVCSGSTQDLINIVIDKRCDIPQMIASCTHINKAFVVRPAMTVGGTSQSNTLNLYWSTRILGTNKCSIVGDTAAFWTSPGEHFQFKNLNITINNYSGSLTGISLFIYIFLF